MIDKFWFANYSNLKKGQIGIEIFPFKVILKDRNSNFNASNYKI